MYCSICGYELNGQSTCPTCGWQSSTHSADENINPQIVYPTQQPAADYSAQGYEQQAAQPYGQTYEQQAAQPYGQTYEQQAAQPYGQYVQAVQQPQAPQPYAGMPIRPAYTPVQPTPGMNNGIPNASDPNPPSGQKKKSKLPLIIILVVLLIAGGITIFLILNKDKEKDLTRDKDNDNDNVNTASDASTTTESTDEPSTEVYPIVNEFDGTRTIMMYIVGSNLESDCGFASEDIQEIIDSNFNSDNINYLIFTGGSYGWDNSMINADENDTLLVKDGQLTLLESQPLENMADPDTLTDFLTYAYENYPASQYDLILWNHGGGCFSGYGHDEVFNDMLSVNDIASAIDESPFGSDNKLDFIGFDACLMASIEVANVLSPYANYLISSQESEPGGGWDYQFLSEIDGLENGGLIGEKIVDYYISTTSDSFYYNPFAYCDITLSVLDLTKVSAVEDAMDELFALANNDLSAATYNDFSRKHNEAKKIAADYSGDNSWEIIDLYHFITQFEDDYSSEATALKDAIDEMIIYSDTNEENAYGVSVYHPYENKTYADAYVDYYDNFDFSDEYTAYIETFKDLLLDPATNAAAWDMSTLNPYKNSDYSFSVELSDEQYNDLQNACYVISRVDPSNPSNYIFVSMSSDITYSNPLTANFDGNILYMENETTGDQYEIMYSIQEANVLHTRYLISSVLFNDNIEEEDAMYCYFVLEVTPFTPQGTIIGCYPIMNYINTNGTEVFPIRYEIDVNDYNYVAFGYVEHEFTANENLTDFNDADWSDVVLHYNYMPVSDGFRTVSGGMIPNNPYFGMFIFEDTQGNRHGSNLVQIQ